MAHHTNFGLPSWEREKGTNRSYSATNLNLASGAISLQSNGQLPTSSRMKVVGSNEILSSARAGTLTATLGEKSLNKYFMEHPKTIKEENSKFELSQFNTTNFTGMRP